MNADTEKRTSKFLSLVLRHKPEKIGIMLDEAGWTDVSGLLEAMEKLRWRVSREDLDFIVRNNAKQRFAFSEDGTQIRASQGHSVEVDLKYDAVDPPEILYHGTVGKFMASIREQGLIKGERHHVHLSKDEATATIVGKRRGAPVLLVVDARAMALDGYEFFVSANGVWLTELVPPKYLLNLGQVP